VIKEPFVVAANNSVVVRFEKHRSVFLARGALPRKKARTALSKSPHDHLYTAESFFANKVMSFWKLR
jgi:hypothetical protein